MEMFHRPLADGVELVSVRTDKFKTGVFSVSLAVPMAAETVTGNALLGDVLYRGSRTHPDIEAISRATTSCMARRLALASASGGRVSVYASPAASSTTVTPWTVLRCWNQHWPSPGNCCWIRIRQTAPSGRTMWPARGPTWPTRSGPG